jgi:hypothetical protein
MRESKDFDECAVSGAMLESENPVITWISDTFEEMIHAQGHQAGRKCYDDDEYFGNYFKITIECFNSKEELEQNQEMMDKFI